MDVMECAFDVFFMRGTRGISRKSDIYDVDEKDTMTVLIQIYHELRMSEIYVTWVSGIVCLFFLTWFTANCTFERFIKYSIVNTSTCTLSQVKIY